MTHTTHTTTHAAMTIRTGDRADARAEQPGVAVVTGASRGLGAAFARGLAAEGWRLVIDARTEDELFTIAAELGGLTEVVALPGDVVDDDHRADLAAAADDLGGARLLVNNASVLGGSPPPPLAEFPLPALLETFEVNALAPIALTQLVLHQLRIRDRRGLTGAILSLTSDAAVEAYEGWGGYGAAKAALDHASAVLAVEEPSVPVWSVDPGDLRTRLHQEAFPGEDISDRPLPETVVPALLRIVRERPPSGRYRAADFATTASATPRSATSASATTASAAGAAAEGGDERTVREPEASEVAR